MPIEIRELIIRTAISSVQGGDPGSMKERDFQLLRQQLLEECRRIVSENTKKTDTRR